MTSIYLHGILAERFPEFSMMELRGVSDATQSLDAIYDGFRLEIIKLANVGIHYAIVVDGKDIKTIEEFQKDEIPQEVHFVPMVCGSGFVALGVGLGVMVGGAMMGTATLAIGSLVITSQMVIMAGLMIAGIGLQMMLAPKPKSDKPESAVAGLSESSFIGTSSANLMVQGSPLPIGYGRMRVGSAVINMTSKSFQTTKKQNDAMLSNNNGKIGEAQIATNQGKKKR